jgi:DNA transformation protein and related proteins
LPSRDSRLANPGRASSDDVGANQTEFVAYVIDQLRRWAAVSARRLFGGHGIYRGAKIFGIVSRDTLYFRTDAANRPEFEAAGMAPFRVGKSGRIALSYHEVPVEVIEEPELLAKWADSAFAAALRRDQAQTVRPNARRGNRSGRRPLKQRKG